MTAASRASPPLTTAYVTWCCGHREVLEVTLAAALREPWLVVLTDYSDPHGAGAWAARLRHPRLRVVRCDARLDAARRPIQSQARAWQAGVDALAQEAGIATVVLADPLALVPAGIAAALGRRPAEEAWWDGDSLLALPARLAREYPCCPAYVGAGPEAADLRARLLAGGERLAPAALGARLLARPPLPPLAAVRLLGLRAEALGWGPAALGALGRLAGGAPVSARNH